MYHMKRSLIAGLVLLSIAIAAPATATNCEYGGKWPNCNPKPEDPKPQDPGQSQQQDQNQSQTAKGGDSDASSNAGAVGIGLGVGTGGAGGDGGSATATGGEGGRGGNAGAAAGISGSGNSTNTLGAVSGSNATGGSIRDAGNSASTSGATSGSSSGAVSTNDIRNGSESSSGAASNSGGNSLANGSQSSSGASNGDQSLTNTNGASADGSGNSSVNVDASTKNAYTSQSLWLPQVETAAPAIVASPVVTIVPGVCGPRVRRISEQVNGTFVGIIKKSHIPLGNDDVAVEMEAEPFRYHQDRAGNVLAEGSRVDYAVIVAGVAASRGIGLGGGETGGNWGQGGVSSNSSIQRPIVRALITPCLLPVDTAPPVISFDKPRVPRG